MNNNNGAFVDWKLIIRRIKVTEFEEQLHVVKLEQNRKAKFLSNNGISFHNFIIRVRVEGGIDVKVVQLTLMYLPSVT